MNWSARRLGASLLAAGLLSACEKPDELGLSLVPPTSQVGVFFSDTFTVRTSMVLLDTLVSYAPTQDGAPAQLLTGRYNDPTFGSTVANSFFTVGQTRTIVNHPVRNRGVCDSAKFFVRFNSLYGDTTRPQTLTLHRLADTLNASRRYYFRDGIAYDNVPLASVTFTPSRSLLGTLLTFKLPAALGQEIFAGIDTTDATRVRKTLRGLALIPAAANTTIQGVANNLALQLYFRDSVNAVQRLSSVGQYVGIYTLGLTHVWTNQVIANRQTSQVPTIARLTQPYVAIPTDTSTNAAYVQSALGIVTKIEFPYLGNLKKLGRVGINKAELVISTALLPQSLLLGPPPALELWQTDATNVPSRAVGGLPIPVPPEGTVAPGAPAQLVGPSSIGQYIFSMSTYTQAMLAGIGAPGVEGITGKKPNAGLLLLPASNASLTGVQVLGGRNVKLRVYYSRLP